MVSAMSPHKNPALEAHQADPEHSPDPLQMTGKDQPEDVPQPTSGRRSMRSRYVPSRNTVPVVEPSPRATISGRKRAQLDVTAESVPEERQARPSKRAKVDTKGVEAAVPAEVPHTNKADTDAPTEVPPAIPSPKPSSAKRGRGRPPSARKTATVDSSKTATTPSRTAKRTSTKAKPNTQETAQAKAIAPTEVKSHSKRKSRAPTAPIRHSSNPLDDEPRPEPAPSHDEPTEPEVLRELEEPEPRRGKTFDLT